MTALQALVLATIQGLTELFPISSLGHAVIIPKLLGWSIDQKSVDFLPFLVVLHVGTATALLTYFWRDWIGLALAVLGIGPHEHRSANRKLFLLIVVATIPAVILGFTFNKLFQSLFGAPVVAAIFLMVNGFVLFFGERLRKRTGTRELTDLRWCDAIKIGLWQSTALFPGISRSGATMVGGLLAGLDHPASARFSFLIATPVIAGAAVLEVPKMIHAGDAAHFTALAAGAGAVAGVTAFLSVAFLMRYFRNHEIAALNPFAWYCWITGLASFTFLAL